MAAWLLTVAALYAAGVGLYESNPTYNVIGSLTRRGGSRGSLSFSLSGGGDLSDVGVDASSKQQYLPPEEEGGVFPNICTLAD